MNISEKFIEKASFLYLSLSLLIFLLTWLNPILATLGAISLITILYYTFKSQSTNETYNISKYLIITAISMSLIWCFLAGIGGLYYQSSDWHIRNAIFRDLINFSYPVIYDNGSALIYYIGQMLPPAIIGKLCNYVGLNSLSFQIANIFNLLWAAGGIFLIIIQLFITTKSFKYWVIAILILFSGMDIVNTNIQQLFLLHIERHSFYQFSSNTTLLFWVYNQTIAVWLTVLQFIKSKNNIANYGLFTILLIYYAPLPFIGMLLYFVFFTLKEFISSIKHSQTNDFLKKLFSIPNILSIMVILPIIYTYYNCNSNNISNMFGIYIYNSESFVFCYKFISCEVGILLLLLAFRYYKNLLFIIMSLHLIIIPFLSIPSAPDFCMRASIPSLFILMIFAIKFLADKNIKTILKIGIVICLIIGALTPAFEFLRGALLMTLPSSDIPVKDNITTLNNRITNNAEWQLLTFGDFIPNFGSYKNYGTTNPKKCIFFNYLAK